jgi:hypothetical protein
MQCLIFSLLTLYILDGMDYFNNKFLYIINTFALQPASIVKAYKWGYIC